MSITKPLMIFGPAKYALLKALDLPEESTVDAMLKEIARLKMAAAEGQTPPRKARKPEKRRRDAVTPFPTDKEPA